MLDPAPAASLDARILKQLAWFTPNETEAAFYLGRPCRTRSKPHKTFLHAGIKGVVLKRGSEGAYVALANGKAAWVHRVSGRCSRYCCRRRLLQRSIRRGPA